MADHSADHRMEDHADHIKSRRVPGCDGPLLRQGSELKPVFIGLLCSMALAVHVLPAPQRLIGGTPTGPAIVLSYAEFPGHQEITPIVAPPVALGLDPFYKKYVDAGGIPVVASEKVRDEA